MNNPHSTDLDRQCGLFTAQSPGGCSVPDISFPGRDPERRTRNPKLCDRDRLSSLRISKQADPFPTGHSIIEFMSSFEHNRLDKLLSFSSAQSIANLEESAYHPCMRQRHVQQTLFR